MSNLANPDLANPNLADPDLADPDLAGGFSPTDLSGLVLWLRPDSSHVTLNGSDVSGITDRSTAGNNASQSDPAAQPLWNASDADFNGHPSVEYDGSSEFLEANGLSSLISGNEDQPWTIIIAGNQTAQGTQASWGNSGTSTPFLDVIIDGSSNMRIQIRDDTSMIKDQQAGTFALPQTDVFQWRGNGTTIDSWLGSTQYLNGADIDVGVLTVDRFVLGASGRPSSPSRMIGKMADIVVYNRALNNDERVQVRDYMTSRYGL